MSKHRKHSVVCLQNFLMWEVLHPWGVPLMPLGYLELEDQQLVKVRLEQQVAASLARLLRSQAEDFL